MAGYFRLPDGRVLHATAGPIDSAELLREAKLALQFHQQYSQLAPTIRLAWARKAHSTANSQTTNAKQIHERLSHTPMPPLEDFYPSVFEGILGEQIRHDESRVTGLRQRILELQNRRMPFLFVLGSQSNVAGERRNWDRTVAMLAPRIRHRFLGIIREINVVELRRDELPAVSMLLSDTPFDVPAPNSPTLIVTTSRGQQVGPGLRYDDHSRLLEQLMTAFGIDSENSVNAANHLTMILTEDSRLLSVESIVISGLLSGLQSWTGSAPDPTVRTAQAEMLYRVRLTARRLKARPSVTDFIENLLSETH